MAARVRIPLGVPIDLTFVLSEAFSPDLYRKYKLFAAVAVILPYGENVSTLRGRYVADS